MPEDIAGPEKSGSALLAGLHLNRDLEASSSSYGEIICCRS